MAIPTNAEAKAAMWEALRERMKSNEPVTFFGADWGKAGDDRTVFTYVSGAKLPEATWRSFGDVVALGDDVIDMKRNAGGVYEFIAG